LRILFDLREPANLSFGGQQLICARFSLSRTEPVPFAHRSAGGVDLAVVDRKRLLNAAEKRHRRVSDNLVLIGGIRFRLA